MSSATNFALRFKIWWGGNRLSLKLFSFVEWLQKLSGVFIQIKCVVDIC